jgi:uncharacterized protein
MKYWAWIVACLLVPLIIPLPAQQTETKQSVNNAELEAIKAKAEKGDPAAQTELGKLYCGGHGVPQDYAESVRWLRKAAEQGNAGGQCTLGWCYAAGLGLPKDYAQAVRWYRKAAEQGDAGAQINLGVCYENGEGAPQDYAEAVKWYRKAAEQGDSGAQINLGLCYEKGHGVPQDYPEAVKWWRKAAETGDVGDASVAKDQIVRCCNRLGLSYWSGQGLPQDYAEAVKWFRQAAEQANADGQFRLGVCYFNGLGVPQNYSEAVKWYRKSAEQSYAEGQYMLGVCYFNGRGVTQDYIEAVKLYRNAAQQGNADGQTDLGVCYATGHGVPQDYAEAVKWLRKAAEQGSADAQYNLCVCYGAGHGVPQSYAEAVEWCRKAAKQGEAAAQCYLGGMFQTGMGVPQDYVEAYKWYNLAAAQNETYAIQYRDILAKSMTPAQIAEGQKLSREFVARKKGGAASGADSLDSAAVENAPRFTGTGFFVSEDGYLLTAFHVVADAARIAIRTKAGTVAAMLVKTDKANDVALLKVAGTFSALPVVSSRGAKLGESVFTIGFPNIQLQGFAPKLTKGEISSLSGMQDDPREFQISVPVQPGNSGGPLVNQYGNVVGVVEAQLADIITLKSTGSLPQNVNYAMKSSALSLLLESVPEVLAKLKELNPSKERKFEDVEKEAEGAVALVLVY